MHHILIHIIGYLVYFGFIGFVSWFAIMLVTDEWGSCKPSCEGLFKLMCILVFIVGISYGIHTGIIYDNNYDIKKDTVMTLSSTYIKDKLPEYEISNLHVSVYGNYVTGILYKGNERVDIRFTYKWIKPDVVFEEINKEISIVYRGKLVLEKENGQVR